MVNCEYCHVTRTSDIIEMDIGSFCSPECLQKYQEESFDQGVESYDYNPER